ncbi:MAG TPA: ROK family protein [Phycisphaerae bacterium]|nr:ROK family protein [Phycisphaerae bacterium]
MAKPKAARQLFVGVDVGGTKVLAALMTEAGGILAREKLATPRGKKPDFVVDAIAETIRAVAASAHAGPGELAAVGLSIPGVVDPDAGRIVITPNMNLTGIEIVRQMQPKLDVPVTLGNDVNCGTLGEKWLGSARDAESAVGIFVGTGIGGGVFLHGEIHRGARESAGEIGHLVMAIGGPKCGCGARGCFEAIASRTAMDRDIRAAIARGRNSIVTKLLKKDTDLIRSGVLRRALARRDKLVMDVMRRAAVVMGHACLSIRHLIDPEVIVFGGGVIEACGDFLLPIVEEIVESDPLTGARPGGWIVESALGDDAVVIGAAALAQQAVGRDPFHGTASVEYPEVRRTEGGAIEVAGEAPAGAVYVTGDGQVGDPGKLGARRGKLTLGTKLLRAVCQGCPQALFVEVAKPGDVKLSDRARSLLHFRRIDLRAAPDAVAQFAAFPGRKALVVG